VTPNHGGSAGGLALVFTGTGFVAGSVPIIDGIVQDSVVVVNSTTITCVSKAHVAGVVLAAVINPNGAPSNTLPFTYILDYLVTQNGDNYISQAGDKFIAQD